MSCMYELYRGHSVLLTCLHPECCIRSSSRIPKRRSHMKSCTEVDWCNTWGTSHPRNIHMDRINYCITFIMWYDIVISRVLSLKSTGYSLFLFLPWWRPSQVETVKQHAWLNKGFARRTFSVLWYFFFCIFQVHLKITSLCLSLKLKALNITLPSSEVEHFSLFDLLHWGMRGDILQVSAMSVWWLHLLGAAFLHIAWNTVSKGYARI